MIFGQEHPDTINARNNLAAMLSEVGRYRKALVLQTRIVSDSERIFGEEHPETISARSNLAATLSEVGRLREALELQTVCIARDNLATTQALLGRQRGS